MSKFLMMTIILPMILVACSNDDQISVEEPEPEILFLEGEYIQLDSTSSICDWFLKSGTSTYHLGNSYDEYFQVKSILTDTQQVVVQYDTISDQSTCHDDLIQNTLANLKLYERLPLFIDNEQYQEDVTTGIFVDSAVVVGDYLILNYQSSGCQFYQWEPYLVDSGIISATAKPQISHSRNRWLRGSKEKTRHFQSPRLESKWRFGPPEHCPWFW